MAGRGRLTSAPPSSPPLRRSESTRRAMSSFSGKAPEAGFWSLVGGKVDFLERAEDAVVRETREEVGVRIEIGPLL